MTLNLPFYVEFICDRLEAAGFEAYAVGGCVRDLLRGVTPGDYDITTSARPEEIKALFEKTADTGIKHGTVTVITEGLPCEVTTFRTEEGYGDFRHPEKVEFVNDIKADLGRRDFTVNAMAYSPARGLIDCFGGRDDLKAGILRTVGDPKARFGEDALRILRLFRFAAVLGFTPQENTQESALGLAFRLKSVSVERIAAELKKALNGENITALSPLIRSGALGFLYLTRDRLCEVQKAPAGNVRLFAFLHLCSTDCEKTARTLKLSAKEIGYTVEMAGLASLSPGADPAEIKRAMTEYGSTFGDWLTYAKTVEGRDVSAQRDIYRGILSRGEPYKIAHLAVNGDDLKELGFSGVEVGRVLERLLQRVIDDPALNTKEKLTELAKL